MTWPVRMPPQASKAQRNLRPVVAAGAAVDLRRAAEFAPDDDRHVLIQAPLVQVGDQGRGRPVEQRAVLRGSPGNSGRGGPSG